MNKVLAVGVPVSLAFGALFGLLAPDWARLLSSILLISFFALLATEVLFDNRQNGHKVMRISAVALFFFFIWSLTRSNAATPVDRYMSGLMITLICLVLTVYLAGKKRSPA